MSIFLVIVCTQNTFIDTQKKYQADEMEKLSAPIFASYTVGFYCFLLFNWHIIFRVLYTNLQFNNLT